MNEKNQYLNEYSKSPGIQNQQDCVYVDRIVFKN